MLRGELELKGKELIDLNSNIIANQNKLDSIKQEILGNTLPFTDNSVGTLGFFGRLRRLEIFWFKYVKGRKNLGQI
ncbi:Uncharacterised protein [Citrobacter freundii]|nr:Uncharacterised protein [Citrobacter freundii]